MTPGQEALAEIARLETATVYSARSNRQQASHGQASPSANMVAAVAEQLRRGNLARTITRTTGVTDEQLAAIADQLGISVRHDFRRLRVVRGAA